MKNKRGISKVVTTVIIVALVLVAIAIIWLLISRLIASNALLARAQQKCLESRFEVKGNVVGDSVRVSVKRLSGSDSFAWVDFYAYNLTSSSSVKHSGNIAVGQLISKEISMPGINGVSIVPHIEIDSKVFPCSPLKYGVSSFGDLVYSSTDGGAGGSGAGSGDSGGNTGEDIGDTGSGEGGVGNSGDESGNEIPPGENTDNEDSSEEDQTPQLGPRGYFVFQIKTTKNNQEFGFAMDNAENLFVDWGDGTNNLYNTVSPRIRTYTRKHSYSTAGVYNVSLKGYATRIAFGGGSHTTPALVTDVLTNLSEGLTGINSGYQMFKGCTGITTFTEPAFFDDVSGDITTMKSMFEGATAFNQSLNNWNTSRVTDMYSMFDGATNFNGDISSWDTSSVTTMEQMFYRATNFNGDISSWDTSSVTDMGKMFLAASSFNQFLNNWDVSSVENMEWMFWGADSFNQPLDRWDTSSVTNMFGMFYYAISFNQNLSSWNVSRVGVGGRGFGFAHILEGANLSTPFYDSILISWSKQDVGSGMVADFNSKYSPAGKEGRDRLVNDFGWTIYDGGPA